MQSRNICLPEPFKQSVDGQIALGQDNSVGKYARELICADEKQKAEAQLHAELLKGLNSAENELTSAEWGAIRQEAVAKVEARTKPR